MAKGRSIRKSSKSGKKPKQAVKPVQWASLDKAEQRAWIAKAFLQGAMTVEPEGAEGHSAIALRRAWLSLLNEAAQGEERALTIDLARAVLPFVRQLREWMIILGTLEKIPKAPPEWSARVARTADELDGALALIARELTGLIRYRGRKSQNSDLLCEAALVAIGDGPEAASLIRRMHQKNPEDLRDDDGEISDGGWADCFAWDAYERVAALDRLTDDFPEEIGAAARKMNAWPMLWHRHAARRKRFDEIANRLRLGEQYPLEASARAKFSPDTPMVGYLDELVYHLHRLWVSLGEGKCRAKKLRKSAADEAEFIRRVWHEWPDDPLDDEVVAVLRICRVLPPLTKATVPAWVDRVVLPYILATDGRDFQNVSEKALQQIAGQNGVKSQATFVSRLKPQVKRTLTSLARPA